MAGDLRSNSQIIDELRAENERLTARLATIEQETREKCAKIADESFDANRQWSNDEDMQNQAYYTAGEMAFEIADKIIRASAITSPDGKGE